MNYDKIGLFIKEKRKEKNLTQQQLANKLGITDKAISKWERGLGFPDVSLLEDISSILDISIIELIKGEKISNKSVETEEYVKRTIKLTKDENKRKRKKIINTILISIMISISIIIITLNIIQIKYLNIKYPYSFDSIHYLDKEKINTNLDKIKNKVIKIKNSLSLYKQEDLNNITTSLEKNLNLINNNSLLNTTKKNNTVKIKDIYILELKKGTNNDFVTNNRNILNILKQYTSTELFNSYYDLYEDNYIYSTFWSANSHQESFTLSKYKLSLKQDDNIAYISYQLLSLKELEYQISDLIYLTNIVMEVGDIDE